MKNSRKIICGFVAIIDKDTLVVSEWWIIVSFKYRFSVFSYQFKTKSLKRKAQNYNLEFKTFSLVLCIAYYEWVFLFVTARMRAHCMLVTILAYNCRTGVLPVKDRFPLSREWQWKNGNEIAELVNRSISELINW